VHDDRLVLGLGRIVALVSDADDLIAESQPEEKLGCRGKK
jgi:hypothetical protein